MFNGSEDSQKFLIHKNLPNKNFPLYSINSTRGLLVQFFIEGKLVFLRTVAELQPSVQEQMPLEESGNMVQTYILMITLCTNFTRTFVHNHLCTDTNDCWNCVP